MACNKPLQAYQPVAGGTLTFNQPRRGDRPHKSLQIPCGQCAGCRLEKSRQWAIRCVHEASLHKENCFVTLTYDDAHLPAMGSLHKPDLQKFFKRLRKHKGPFRYYACGEYGDTTQRAHYHACIFGLDFQDKIEFRKIGPTTLYLSETLTRIWGNGNTSVGALTFESAAYTARYVMKKQTGLAKGGGYVHLDPQTGELTSLVQPFANMSLRSAIAKDWLHRYHGDIYNKDYIVVRGRKHKPAKYYDTLYDSINPEHMAKIKQERIENSEKMTTEELHAREKMTRARLLNRKQV